MRRTTRSHWLRRRLRRLNAIPYFKRQLAFVFVLPWLLIPVFTWLPGGARLTGNRTFLTILGIGLAAWGAYTARLLLRNPEELASTENHPAWTHMYLMLMCAQAGFAVGYLV